jgi:hypothetical protein
LVTKDGRQETNRSKYQDREEVEMLRVREKPTLGSIKGGCYWPILFGSSGIKLLNSF